jgi:hypothetical protein
MNDAINSNFSTQPNNASLLDNKEKSNGYSNNLYTDVNSYQVNNGTTINPMQFQSSSSSNNNSVNENNFT